MKDAYARQATHLPVDKNGCTPQKDMIMGGFGRTSDYSVSEMDNWVERANQREVVVTRTKHV